MILYHVAQIYSTQLNKNGEKEFIPRVPEFLKNEAKEDKENRLLFNYYEDDKIPRISFSKSIEGCFTACGSSNYCFDYNGDCYIYVYFVDRDKLDKSKIISNDELVGENLVHDALYTGEVWYTKPLVLKPHIFKLDSIYYKRIFINNEEKKDHIFNYLKEEDKKLLDWYDQFNMYSLLNGILKNIMDEDIIKEMCHKLGLGYLDKAYHVKGKYIQDEINPDLLNPGNGYSRIWKEL